MNKLSLKNQFLILFLIIQIIILGLIFYYFIHSHTQFYYEQLKEYLIGESKLILANEKVNLNKNSAEEIDTVVKKWGKELGLRITIIKKEGTVIADSTYDPAAMDNHRNRPEIKEVLSGSQQGTVSRKSETLSKEMFYLAYPIQENGEISGVIRLAKSLNNINTVVKRDIIRYFIFILLILVFTFFLIWRFTAKLVNPLTEMTEMAREIARGNYKERIKLKNYGNEIGIMARMFNFMAEKLENTINVISEERNKMEAVLNGMADGVIAVDFHKKTVLINPAAKDIFSVNEANVKGKEIINIVRNHRIDQNLDKVLADKEYIEMEIELTNSEGKKKNIHCHFAPIIDKKNRVSGGVIVFTDITELRKLEQVRKDFVANVSHELRTPLTSIIGYVDTLLENEIEDLTTINKFLNIIKKEADRLALLIRDLLHLSKVEDQAPVLKMFHLDTLISKSIKVVEELARKNNITIRKELADNLPPVLMVPDQIEQVFINLLDNAIKYNGPGGDVVVRAYRGEKKVFVEIEDNGFGIPAADQERIFERFYRVDKARSRELGGTGIGLSIVKNIIKSHRGKIEVESEVGKGAVFRFYLLTAE